MGRPGKGSVAAPQDAATDLFLVSADDRKMRQPGIMEALGTPMEGSMSRLADGGSGIIVNMYVLLHYHTSFRPG